jgi:hypothetical protein
MKRIWEADVNDYFKDFHEQTVLANIFTEDSEARSKIRIIPYGDKDELVTYWGNYFPNKHFAVHCARCSFDKLSFMYMMDIYYPHKLDEETDDEFNSRLEWITNTYLCRMDIESWLTKKQMKRNYSARCRQTFII